MKGNEFANLVKDAYPLAWHQADNPNGWIEPTTFCQLKCPGCYRGVDKDNHKMLHEDFIELKNQIDQLIESRNIQTLSIAGGEPLLYPKINEIIRYASEKGLRTMIYTNGLVLDENKLRALKDSGATQLVLHIDQWQNRNGHNNKPDLIKLREDYCNLFRKVGGVNLGFIQPLSGDNLKDIDLLLSFYKKNLDVVNLIVFTLYREICWDHAVKPAIDTNITVQDVVSQIRKNHKYYPCAYLGSTNNAGNPTWLFSILTGTNDHEFGFIDGKMYKFIQERYRKNKGRYLFLTRKNEISLIKLFRHLNFKCVRNIVRSYFKQYKFFSHSIYFQTMLILRGPQKQGKNWDLCQGCPDAMFYQNNLVPSCILEEIKKNQ